MRERESESESESEGREKERMSIKVTGSLHLTNALFLLAFQPLKTKELSLWKVYARA